MLKSKSRVCNLYFYMRAFHYIIQSLHFQEIKKTTISQLILNVICKRNLNIDNDNDILPSSHESDIGSFSPNPHSEFEI